MGAPEACPFHRTLVGEGLDDKGFQQVRSCFGNGPSSSERESFQWGNLASG